MEESTSQPPSVPQPSSTPEPSSAPPPQPNIEPPSSPEPAPSLEQPPAPPPPPTSVTPDPAAASPKKSGGKRLVMAVGVLLVVVGGGYAAYRYLQPHPKPVAAHVKIGVMLAFSGGSSSMGYGANKGIQLAKQQLNANNIDLIPADGRCDPTAALTALKYLIAQHVIAVIGENCSSASVAVLPTANANHMLLLSPSASSPLLSIAGDYFYRTVPSDKGQGAFLASSMYKAGIRRAAVFYTAEPYGSAINDVFTTQFEALGGKVVAAVSAPSSVINVAAQVAAIKAAKPDGLAIVTNSTVSSTAVMQKSRAAGIAVPFYGGDNLYDNTIITNNGTAAEGLHVVSFPTGSVAFKQALLDQYHESAQLYAAPEAYDAFHALYIAIQKGATTSDQIKAKLPSIAFDGASGHIQFDKYGDIPYQGYKYDLLVVKNGAFQIVNP